MYSDFGDLIKYSVILSILLSIMILLEIIRLLYNKLQSPYRYFSSLFLLQLLAYSLGFFSIITKIVYVILAAPIESEFQKTGKALANFHILLLDSVSISLFFSTWMVTLYAIIVRFTRIVMQGKRYKFILDRILPAFLLLLVSLRIIYSFWLNFTENSSCKWSKTTYCLTVFKDLKSVIPAIFIILFAIIELVLCLILIRICFRLEDQMYCNKASFRNQNRWLFLWLLFIISLDIASLVIGQCLPRLGKPSVAYDLISTSIFYIHSFASFNFLGQLKNSIDLAHENTLEKISETIVDRSSKTRRVNFSV